eukprot:TRINITY_DN2108_c0_g4_i3.p1 TRINITY_DN2108_c0_g4~~TRINITY_DN2108_c0_g4_i3.p1  ORF type:complete len:975 (-),score=142.71 TRINITY_DN2108_c0_g4_i3:360-3284(-)
MSAPITVTYIERRELIKFLIEDFQDRGGKVLLPVGMDALEDWLVDNIDAQQLLTRVKARIHPLDLARMCHQQTTMQQTKQQLNQHGQNQEPIPLLTLIDQQPENLEDSAQVSRKQSQLLTVDIAGSELMAEEEIVELCQLTLLLCLGKDDLEKQYLGEWLQVSQTQVEELDSVVQSSQVERGRSLIAMLLDFARSLRPKHFSKFSAFSTYQGVVLKFIIQTLVNSLEEAGSSRSGLGIQELRARLYGVQRRLSVTQHSDYHENEYADALEELERVLQMCGGGVETGNWYFPKGLAWRMSLCLLQGLFDDIEEDGFHREKDKLYDVLQRHVWPALGISQGLHQAVLTWAYFTQFLTQNPLSDELIAILEKSLKRLQPNGEEIANLVINNIEKQVMLKLESYHDYAQGEDVDRNLLVNLRLLMHIQAAKGVDKDRMASLVQHCIESSLETEIKDIWRKAGENHQQPSEAGQSGTVVAEAAQEVLAMLEEELSQNAPILETYCSHAKEVALQCSHKQFAQTYFVWLVQVDALDRDTLQGIRCAEQLEQFILDRLKEIDPNVLKAIKLWESIKKVTGLLIAWTNTQNAKLLSWLRRLAEKENWNYVGKSEYYSASAVELCRMADEATASLFNMGIGLPAAVVASLLEGINSLIQQFVVNVNMSLPKNIEDCVPPRPGLTRYKQELAAKAAKADEKLLTGGSEEDKFSHREDLDVRLAQLPQDSIICRLNSLEFVERHLNQLKREILGRWGDLPWPAGNVSSPLQGWSANDLFPIAEQTLISGTNHINQLLAIKIVYWDGREAWLERLYRHRVAQNGIDEVGIMVQLDSELGYVAGKVSDQSRDQFAELLLITVLGCFERILLDGGPTRLFIADDARELEMELMKIRGLFVAGGEGLPAELVDQHCAEVSKILSVMACETPVVIANIGSKQQILDDQTLIRILGHRADRAASKYLKKEFKLPKKIDEGTFSKFKNVFRR